MKKTVIALISLVLLSVALPSWACTTTLMGKKASVDGSVMVSHSDDGLSDARLIYVPAMDHKSGSLRPVFYSHCALDFKPQWGASETQRIVTRDRGPGYDTTGDSTSVPLGFIPQVRHTYAYFDANYGIIRELFRKERGVYKKKSTDEKVDALGSGYDLDALFKKDARGKYTKCFRRMRQVEKNRHPVLFPPDWLQSHGERLKEIFYRPMGNVSPETMGKQSMAIGAWKGCCDRLGEINTPTLVITGADDALVPPQNARYLAGKIPNAQFVLSENSGHGLMFQPPDKFSEKVIGFLKDTINIRK